jgi:hypothetical protein
MTGDASMVQQQHPPGHCENSTKTDRERKNTMGSGICSIIDRVNRRKHSSDENGHRYRRNHTWILANAESPIVASLQTHGAMILSIPTSSIGRPSSATGLGVQ